MKEWHILFDSFPGIKSKVLRGITWLFLYILNFCLFTSVLISSLCFIDCRAILSSRHITMFITLAKVFRHFFCSIFSALVKASAWERLKKEELTDNWVQKKSVQNLKKLLWCCLAGDNVYHASDMTWTVFFAFFLNASAMSENAWS